MFFIYNSIPFSLTKKRRRITLGADYTCQQYNSCVPTSALSESGRPDQVRFLGRSACFLSASVMKLPIVKRYSIYTYIIALARQFVKCLRHKTETASDWGKSAAVSFWSYMKNGWRRACYFADKSSSILSSSAITSSKSVFSV